MNQYLGAPVVSIQCLTLWTILSPFVTQMSIGTQPELTGLAAPLQIGQVQFEQVDTPMECIMLKNGSHLSKQPEAPPALLGLLFYAALYATGCLSTMRGRPCSVGCIVALCPFHLSKSILTSLTASPPPSSRAGVSGSGLLSTFSDHTQKS